MIPKKSLIFVVIIVLTVAGLLGGWYYFFRQQPKPLTLIPHTTEFTVSAVKLNKRDRDITGELPNIQLPGAVTLNLANNPRRKVSKDGEVVTVITRGSNTYQIAENKNWFHKTVLLKNNTEIWSKMLVFTTFDPIRSFFATDTAVVLAYEHSNNGKGEADVVINGRSMNETYDLTASFAAFQFDSKIVFLTQKEQQFYIVVNERFYKLPSSIKEIIDPPCCMPAAFAVSADTRNMVFYAEGKDGFWYQYHLQFPN